MYTASVDQAANNFVWTSSHKTNPICLSVALLQTCKQVNNEAVAIFYGRDIFTLDGQKTCVAFLSLFSKRAPLLRRIAVRSDPRRSIKEYYRSLRPLFQALRQLVNLEVLFVDSNFWSNFSGSPTKRADIFCLGTREWKLDQAVKDGNKLAVLDVVRVPKSVSPSAVGGRGWPICEDGQQIFRARLSKRLGSGRREADR